ncbi:hypothetical protein [Streptomyces sp. NPDC086023]
MRSLITTFRRSLTRWLHTGPAAQDVLGQRGHLAVRSVAACRCGVCRDGH